MKIGGFHKFSLIDYPERTCAVIFTQGCNFKCPYCHNPELVLPESFKNPLPADKIISFLENRNGLLDGITVTGGEPTLQDDLLDFLGQLKQIGFLVKLDTNGSNPDVLSEIIRENLVDYIAMDIKAPFDKYHVLAGVKCNHNKIKKSIKLIEESGILYEFRTTIIPSLLNVKDLLKIPTYVQNSKCYKVQNFQYSDKMVDKSLLQLNPNYTLGAINDKYFSVEY